MNESKCYICNSYIKLLAFQVFLIKTESSPDEYGGTRYDSAFAISSDKLRICKDCIKIVEETTMKGNPTALQSLVKQVVLDFKEKNLTE